VKEGEVWLVGCDIAPYPQANLMNHEPRRVRKLLLRKSEIRKFAESATQQGLTLVPLAMYFRRGLVKVSLAIARGRKLHDKREKLKTSQDKRSIRDAMKQRINARG
jgi:SsrA-binding protein